MEIWGLSPTSSSTCIRENYPNIYNLSKLIKQFYPIIPFLKANIAFGLSQEIPDGMINRIPYSP